MHQFDALPSVQYRRWEPGKFAPPEASQTHTTYPEQVETAAPVGQVHHGIRDLREVCLPMVGDVVTSGQVEGVVAPALGHTVRRSHAPPLIWPLRVIVRVAVEIHPLRREVPQHGQISRLRVDPAGGELRPLYGYVDSIHLADLLDPGERVLRVQDDDETGAVSCVFLLPQFQNLCQMKSLASCSRGGDRE